MFVPCPHCQFLVAHHPQLRPMPADCPRCGRPLEEDAGQEDAGQEDALQQDAGPATEAASADARGTPETPAAAIAFAPQPRRRNLVPWRWPLIALLAVLLVLQLLLADRARLAEDARWRPLLENLCGVLQCELPAWHQPSAFTMLDRKVRPASQQPGALRVDATFRNDARWAQPWPALQLALSDADGRVLGSRVFPPREYLGTAPTTRLSPGQSAQITFLVQEPAPGTVAFSFEFR